MRLYLGGVPCLLAMQLNTSQGWLTHQVRQDLPVTDGVTSKYSLVPVCACLQHHDNSHRHILLILTLSRHTPKPVTAAVILPAPSIIYSLGCQVSTSNQTRNSAILGSLGRPTSGVRLRHRPTLVALNCGTLADMNTLLFTYPHHAPHLHENPVRSSPPPSMFTPCHKTRPVLIITIIEHGH